MSRFSVACLDMAGTTVRDDNTVMNAFAAAIASRNLPEVEGLPGAVELFAACRDAGIRVCLSTGFSPATRDAVISALGWGSLVDLLPSPADAGRGRPWPDIR